MEEVKCISATRLIDSQDLDYFLWAGNKWRSRKKSLADAGLKQRTDIESY